jgi:hypothetical protein
MLLIYNDVIDVENCDRLIAEHDANPEKTVLNSLDTAFDNRVLFLQRMSRPVQEITATVALEIGKLIGRHFQIALYPETVSVVRWSPGDDMAVHRDGQNPHTINRTHAVVLYLNDQDRGGQIYFPEIGVVISPRQALLVAYDKNLLHGVQPVETPRYTLTLWYTDQEKLSIVGSP